MGERYSDLSEARLPIFLCKYFFSMFRAGGSAAACSSDKIACRERACSSRRFAAPFAPPSPCPTQTPTVRGTLARRLLQTHEICNEVNRKAFVERLRLEICGMVTNRFRNGVKRKYGTVGMIETAF